MKSRKQSTKETSAEIENRESEDDVSVETLSDEKIEELYKRGRFHVIQEINNFMLPQVIDYVKRKQWINVKPEYQRRHRWDKKKKSQLIESFLMNVPIPPIFLYEHDINRYEVMDGQQRLNAILEFCDNEFELSGLKIWKSLIGRKYRQLPKDLRSGLDRSKVSATILAADSSAEQQPVKDLRIHVFERLNTGGEKLNPQELRNCLFYGSFNNLIVELASWPVFANVWEIPVPTRRLRPGASVPEELRENTLYRTMADCQIVLRFFAFREAEHIVGSVRRTLDDCMERYRDAPPKVIGKFRSEFKATFEFAKEVFGADLFRLPAQGNTGKRPLSRPLYDAVMVALWNVREKRNSILAARMKIRERVARSLASPKDYEIIVGRPNTANAIRARIRRIERIIKGSIG